MNNIYIYIYYVCVRLLPILRIQGQTELNKNNFFVMCSAKKMHESYLGQLEVYSSIVVSWAHCFDNDSSPKSYNKKYAEFHGTPPNSMKFCLELPLATWLANIHGRLAPSFWPDAALTPCKYPFTKLKGNKAFQKHIKKQHLIYIYIFLRKIDVSIEFLSES